MTKDATINPVGLAQLDSALMSKAGLNGASNLAPQAPSSTNPTITMQPNKTVQTPSIPSNTMQSNPAVPSYSNNDPNPVIQNFFSDKTVPLADRKSAYDALHSGILDQQTLLNAINGRFGNKYGQATMQPNPTAQMIPDTSATMSSSTQTPNSSVPTDHNITNSQGYNYDPTKTSAPPPGGFQIADQTQQPVDTSQVPGWEKTIAGGMVNTEKGIENFAQQQAPELTNAIKEETSINPLERTGKFIGQAAQGVGNIGAGLLNAGVGFVQSAPTALKAATDLATGNYTPQDTAAGQQMIDQSTKGMQGINQAITGIGQLASSPLAASPVLTKGVSLPFEAAHSAIGGALTSLGIDPNSEHGKTIADSLVNALAIATIGPEKISKGITDVLNPIKNGINTIKGPSTPEEINKTIDTGIQKGIRPSVSGKQTLTQMNNYFDNARDAVKSIISNKDKLSLTTPEGETVTGQLPKNLTQFSEAINQTKQQIFQRYDALAKQAGDSGLSLDHSNIIDELQQMSNDKTLRIAAPGVIEYANKLADRFKDEGNLSPSETQSLIQNYNKKLETFYRNPTPEAIGNAFVDSMVANKLRGNLDKGITETTGTGYQGLKDQYGSLRSIEKDVNHRAIVDARKNTVGLGQNIADVASAAEAVHGIVNSNPASILSSAAIKGISAYIKYLNDPNTIVKNMFKKAEQGISKLNYSNAQQ